MMSPYAQDKKLYDLVRPEGNSCGVFSIVKSRRQSLFDECDVFDGEACQQVNSTQMICASLCIFVDLCGLVDLCVYLWIFVDRWQCPSDSRKLGGREGEARWPVKEITGSQWNAVDL